MKKNNIVLVGGGSTWTPGILKAMTTHLNRFGLNRVVLYDTDGERQSVIGEFAKILFAEEAPGVEMTYTRDKEEALILWLGKPERGTCMWITGNSLCIDDIACEEEIEAFGLNLHDYDNLTWNDEPLEVFITLD